MSAARFILLLVGAVLTAAALTYAWVAPPLSGATITATLAVTAGVGLVATAMKENR